MRAFIYLFIYLFIYSCKGQSNIVEVSHKDILVFENTDNMIHKDNNFNTKVFQDKFIIIKQKWMPYGSYHFNKEYIFIKKKDTMNIRCFCGQERNYYFKNMEFKKGNYQLTIDYPKKYNEGTKIYEEQIKYIYGRETETSKEVQNILFKNADYDMLRKPEYKDLYFKDLKFIEIDLSDTINVKLKKVDKF